MVNFWLRDNLGFENLNLGSQSERENKSSKYMTATESVTYKVMPILDVASNRHLACGITGILLLDWPFAPIKGIDCPWSQIIAVRRKRRVAVV